MARGTANPRVGAERGRAEGSCLVGDFSITIEDLAACVAAPDHPAQLGGTVSFGDLADQAPITEGLLQLYAADAETGMKQMRYRVAFQGTDGQVYRLEATKFIRPGRATVREQVTAYARLFAVDAPVGVALPTAVMTPPAESALPTSTAASSTPAPPTAAPAAVPPSPAVPVAAGVLIFRLRDLPAFLWSMRAHGASRAVGLRQFLAFARKELSTSVPGLAT